MSDDLLQNLLYFSLLTGTVLVALLISFRTTIARLQQKNYFLNRDRERYAETLYASKDGYFAFIFPDERIKDPRRNIRERCSRRLAVMLNLANGTQSSFDDVVAAFIKEDAAKIRKYLSLMQEENIPFEDIFTLKNGKRRLRIFGARINGADGNLYCDMLWFRDLSAEMLKISALESEKQELEKHLKMLENLIDNLDSPVWLRNNDLRLSVVNKKYVEFSGLKDKDTVLQRQYEFKTDDFKPGELARQAQLTQKAQKTNLTLVLNGQAHSYEMTESPFHDSDRLDRIGTAGILTDMTELDAVKRNFKIHQTAHLEVLSALGTAFAIFNPQRRLIFFNKAFANLWNLNTSFLDATPTYGEFLETIRTSRMLPEVSDFRSFKSEEDKLFGELIESKEDLLHIPDGRTFRRVAAPHPNGLIFAYEDVSDRLAATRMINELVSVQQNILDHISEPVIIFGPDQRLRYFNRSYLKLWKADEIKMNGLPSLSDVLEMQKIYFKKVENWDNLKQSMLAHILNICSRFRLERSDGLVVEAVPGVLSDESVMITYKTN